MDIGTVLSVAQTLFAALQCKELREVCSILNYKSELERFECTVNTVKAALEEVESEQVHGKLTSPAQHYVDQLNDVLYDADDLLDEFVTLARRKKLIKGGKISEKVRLLFPWLKTTAYIMSQGVKEIRKKLDNIANDYTEFGFKLESKPILRRREETCSYVYVRNIIGREDDVDKIMDRLLDPDAKQDVSCLTIVGIGGLGKTALTQVVYSHPSIKENFPLRLWTCVADQDIKGLDVEDTLRKILHSVTRLNHDDQSISMENVQIQLRAQLAGKKYFLVLDDVWNEDRYQWLKLMEFLRGGLKGSWVLVTTRSRLTATVVGGEMHELKGLSDDDSWQLFEKTAFVEDHERTTRVELDQIGREIVKQCANVPLAIRVVGTALYGQDKRKWLSFQ